MSSTQEEPGAAPAGLDGEVFRTSERGNLVFTSAGEPYRVLSSGGFMTNTGGYSLYFYIHEGRVYPCPIVGWVPGGYKPSRVHFFLVPRDAICVTWDKVHGELRGPCWHPEWIYDLAREQLDKLLEGWEICYYRGVPTPPRCFQWFPLSIWEPPRGEDRLPQIKECDMGPADPYRSLNYNRWGFVQLGHFRPLHDRGFHISPRAPWWVFSSEAYREYLRGLEARYCRGLVVSHHQVIFRGWAHLLMCHPADLDDYRWEPGSVFAALVYSPGGEYRSLNGKCRVLWSKARPAAGPQLVWAEPPREVPEGWMYIWHQPQRPPRPGAPRAD